MPAYLAQTIVYGSASSGQARAVKRIFKLAKSSRRIKRIYFYQWLYDPGSHWDSAFIDRHGKRRPAYFALRKGLRKR